jgi:hypothetical protein
MGNSSIPPYGTKFSYVNETWTTAGWTKKSAAGDDIWCRESESTSVIGKNIKADSGLKWIIVPVADLSAPSPTNTWDYEVEQSIGRRVCVVEGELVRD